jgi:hypothetical protein
MRFNKLVLGALFLLGLGLQGIKAQETVSPTGGNASGAGGTVSYTVGQVAYSTYFGANGSVAEGVQQPYEISVYVAVPQTEGIHLAMAAYPNPATDHLMLTIGGYDNENLSYQLFDANGKLIAGEKITQADTRIGMSGLAVANYFLKVTDNGKEIKTFKIIKTK